MKRPGTEKILSMASLPTGIVWLLLVSGGALAQDIEKPGVPGEIEISSKTRSSITLNWGASSDNVGVVEYRAEVRRYGSDYGQAIRRIIITGGSPEFASRAIALNDLEPHVTYEVRFIALDAAGNESDAWTQGDRSNTIRFRLGEGSTDDMRSYIFGHSLINHALGDSPRIQNVPFWLNELARQSGHKHNIDGQFGFLPDQILPPWYQWEIETVGSAWNESFKQSEYDNVIITAANFVQNWQRPDGRYVDASVSTTISRTDNDVRMTLDDYFRGQKAPELFYQYIDTSVLAEGLRILDHVRAETPEIRFYIYENWPPFEGDYPFPANSKTFKLYHQYSTGDFHGWWIEMQDRMNEARPEGKVMLIPAGSTISNLLSKLPELSSLTMDELYDDSAPHGKASIYFLASLVCYMSLYEERPPVNLTIPDTLPVQIRNEYQAIVDYMWN